MQGNCKSKLAVRLSSKCDCCIHLGLQATATLSMHLLLFCHLPCALDYLSCLVCMALYNLIVLALGYLYTESSFCSLAFALPLLLYSYSSHFLLVPSVRVFIWRFAAFIFIEIYDFWHKIYVVLHYGCESARVCRSLGVCVCVVKSIK